MKTAYNIKAWQVYRKSTTRAGSKHSWVCLGLLWTLPGFVIVTLRALVSDWDFTDAIQPQKSHLPLRSGGGGGYWAT